MWQNFLLITFLSLTSCLQMQKKQDVIDFSFKMPVQEDPMKMGELAKKGYGKLVTTLLGMNVASHGDNIDLINGLKKIIEDTEAKIGAENKLFGETQQIHERNVEDYKNSIRQAKIEIATTSSLLSENLYPSRDGDTQSKQENQKRIEEADYNIKYAEKQRLTQIGEIKVKETDLTYAIEVCREALTILQELRSKLQEEKSLNVFLQTHRRKLAQLNSNVQNGLGKLRKDFEYRPIVDALTDISSKKVDRDVLEKVLELLRELVDSFEEEKKSLGDDELLNEKNYQDRLEALKNERQVSVKIVDETTGRLEEIQKEIQSREAYLDRKKQELDTLEGDLSNENQLWDKKVELHEELLKIFNDELEANKAALNKLRESLVIG